MAKKRGRPLGSGMYDRRLYVPISEPDHEALQAYAEAEGRSMAEVARRAIAAYITQHHSAPDRDSM